MKIRRGMRRLILGGTALMAVVIGGMMSYCLFRSELAIHLTTLTLLTTSGPLVARVFEGLVRRRQRMRDLAMDCLEADDEVLIARTVPLVMPIAGAAFSYFVML